MISRKNKVTDILNDDSLFRILYIISLMLCSVVFIEIAANIARSILFVWGTYLTFRKFATKEYKKVFYKDWLIAFLMLGFLTAVIHFKGHFFENIVMLLHSLMCFFVFYGMYTESDKSKIKNELNTIGSFVIFSTTVFSILGLLLAAFIGKSIVMASYPVPIVDDLFSFDAKFFGYKLIIYENRFTGVYTNPNLLGFSSITALFFCHMALKKKSFGTPNSFSVSKKLIIICIAVNLLSVFICDSNSSFLFIVGYITLLLIYNIFTSDHKIIVTKSLLKKIIAFVLALAVVIAALFALKLATQKITSCVISLTRIEADDAPNEKITFEHENANIDSGRFKLWEQSLSYIKAFPLLGIGKGNIIDFGKELFEGGMKYSDFHNGYITIMVSSGILGFLIFIIFAFLIGKKVLTKLFDKNSDFSDDVFPCIVAFTSTYCVYSLVEKTMLFDITFMVVFFWYVLGYGITYLADDAKQTLPETSHRKSSKSFS